MSRTKKTNVTIETERLLVVSGFRRQDPVWCDSCRAVVRMISVAEAALIAGTSQRSIFQRIEEGRLHFGETARGALLICLDALLAETRAER